MNREEFFYLLPYIFALAISLGVFLYSWRHRHIRGADIYTWFVGGQTVTVLAFIFELISPSLQIKVLWDKFQWLTDSFLVFIPFLLFAVQFSEHKLRFPRLTWGIWLSFPILFTLLLFTDNMHHLIYPNPHLSADYPFPDLQYDFTFVIYIYALIYVYSINLYGIGLLIKRAVQPHNTYRAQYWTIAIGFLIPLVLSIFSLADIKITEQRDIAPFSFALGNLIVAWGLFRYRLFDIVPIARERIVESMIDPIFVLDANNRVVDINPPGIKALGKPSAEVIGHSASEVFAHWPMMASELEYLDVERKEIAIKDGDDTFYYDLNISPIYNQRPQLLGRIIVARDITRYKTLESGYRILSEELEQRIKERTQELRQTAEQYRAVVENQQEFIVRWLPDGTRTFVNEAYCRYFGITSDQALATGFMPLIAEEDRQMVSEKMSRLNSGTINSEMDVHRVIKADGTLGWHEWTDQAIRDESGQIIEFQSVGRDITERKQAEEELRESEAIYRKAIEVAGAVPYRQSYPSEEFHIIYDFIGEGIHQITGYKAEEFNEALWDSLVRESHLMGELAKYSLKEAAHQVRTGASPIWQCEHRIQTRTGETRWVYEAAVEIRDKDGKSHGSIGLYQDITERKQAEEALRESEERFAVLSSATFEAIGLSDYEKIIDINEQMLQMFGYTRSEIVGINIKKLLAPESIELVKRHRNLGLETAYEHLSIKKDGTIFPVEVRPRTIPYKGSLIRVTAIRDITERKKTELRILHLNRLYVTISQINQTIVHASNRDDLFIDICRVAIDHGKFRMAWIGLLDETHERIKPLVFAGEEQGYLGNLDIKYHDRVLGSGPTGTAVREGRCIICQDIATDPRMAPWREQALSRGYRSSAAVPIREKGRVIGALTVYADDVNGFNAENEDLLEQIGQDVSFALDSIQAEAERRRAEANLEEAYDTTLEGWAKALELRDKETEGHSRRVTETTLAVARAMDFSEEELVHIRRGSILHDIGKMGIPDQILRKPGPLTDEERQIVMKHPDTAYNLLKQISYLEPALDIPYYHHEKWDGTGYPRGLKREEIPLAARIFAIVDVWDALTSDRPYRKAWDREDVIRYVIDDSGKHFDPRVVDVFLALIGKGEI
ncbi:MAG: PAS domain S-box protein [Chloroflexota bacterium]